MVSKKIRPFLAILFLAAALGLIVAHRAAKEAGTAFDAATAHRSAVAWEFVSSVSPPPAGTSYLLSILPVRAAISWDKALTVATPAGIMVHAGSGRFEAIGPGRGLCPCDLTALAARGGELWAGTRDSGFFRLRRGWAEALRLPGDARANAVRVMASGREAVFAATAGGVWSLGNEGALKVSDRGDISVLAANSVTGALLAGTGDGALLFLEPGGEPRLEVFGSAGNDGAPVRAAVAEGSGFIVGTTAGAFRIDPLGRVTTVAVNANVTAFAEAGDRCLALTEDGWAFRIPEAGSPGRASTRVEDGTVRGSGWIRSPRRPVAAGLFSGGFFLAAEEGVWIGTDLEGLLRGGGNPWRPEPGQGESHCLSTPVVSAILQTGVGLLAGHFDGGVDLIADGGTLSWKSNEDPRLREVNAIRPVSTGVAGVCTSVGLALLALGNDAFSGGPSLNEGPRPAVTNPDFRGIGVETWISGAERLAGSAVYDIARLDDGAMLIASSGGVTIADPSFSNFRQITVLNGLPGNRVYTLARAGSGVLAGTLSGIALIDGGTVTAVWDTATTGLSAPWVTALAVCDGPNREVLVGTYGGGGAVWTQGGGGRLAKRRHDRGRLDGRGSNAASGKPGEARWQIHGRGRAIGFNAVVSVHDAALFGTLDRGIMVAGRTGSMGKTGYLSKWLTSPVVFSMSLGRNGVVLVGTGAGISSVPLREILENAE